MSDRWKCNSCHLIFKEEDKVDGACPECREVHLEKMCVEDHLCTCTHEVTYGVTYCKVCGQPTCPCGSHDVEVYSRVTGYIQALGGFNESKKQELKDRNRVTI